MRMSSLLERPMFSVLGLMKVCFMRTVLFAESEPVVLPAGDVIMALDPLLSGFISSAYLPLLFVAWALCVWLLSLLSCF